MGKQSKEWHECLGYHSSEEVLHRDNIVLLSSRCGADVERCLAAQCAALMRGHAATVACTLLHCSHTLPELPTPCSP
jgi:hypothetical protein